MSNEMDEYIDKASERNKDQQIAKKSRLSYLVRECKSDYRENIKIADFKSLNEDHNTLKQKALNKFDLECKSCDTESRDLRDRLERDINSIYSKMKTAIERDRDAQVQVAKVSIVSCRNKVFKQFLASVDNYGSQHYKDLERSLKKEKRDRLRAYDRELNSNTERNAVQENKQEMSDEMDDYIDIAFERNKDQQVAKKSRVRVLLMDCRSDYKDNINRADLESLDGDHKIYKERALHKFDSECESDVHDGEASDMRRELEREIVVIYNNVKTAKKRDHDVEVQMTIGEVTACRNEVFKQFQASLDEYAHRYYEDLDGSLKNEKRAKLRDYDAEVKLNTERSAVLKNRQTLSREMDSYILKAFQANEDQQRLAEAEYEKFGNDLADRFEKNLREMLAKASVAPQCINEACDDFIQRNVFKNSRFKVIPKWGQQLVQKAIAKRAAKLKEEVRRNMNHREVKVDDSSVLAKVWRALKLFVGGLAELAGVAAKKFVRGAF